MGEIHSPLVFQCGSCSALVGDSLSLVGYPRDDLGCLSLERVVGVTRSVELSTTSSSGADGGATYHAVHCAYCQATLGKAYVRTSTQLSSLQGLVSFDVAALKSFELGTATATAATLPLAAHAGPAGGGGGGKRQWASSASSSSAAYGGSDDEPAAAVRAELFRVEEERKTELMKVQKIVLHLAERISTLERERDAPEVAAAAGHEEEDDEKEEEARTGMPRRKQTRSRRGDAASRERKRRTVKSDQPVK